jgi:thiamine-monophosphate kinase
MTLKPGPPGEFELIARYFAPLAWGFPGAYGLLDDAALISPASGNELVVKSDVIVGGIDFPPGTPADLVARKGLRVNLSDLAAKGAVPRGYLLDLILPNCRMMSMRRGSQASPPASLTTRPNTTCI